LLKEKVHVENSKTQESMKNTREYENKRR